MVRAVPAAETARRTLRSVSDTSTAPSNESNESNDSADATPVSAPDAGQRRSRRFRLDDDESGVVGGSAATAVKTHTETSIAASDDTSFDNSDSASEHSDGATTGSDDDDEDEEVVPLPPRKSKSAKVTTSARHQRQLVEPEATNAADDGLFDALCSPGISVESLVKGWVRDYQRDRPAAVLALLQFLVRSSGCEAQLQADQLEGGVDEMTGVVEDLQEYLEHKTIVDFPLKSSKKEFKKFRKLYADFWSRWMVSVQYMFLFDDEDDAADTAGGRRRSKVPLNAAAFATGKDVFELILGFAVAMSSSSYRPFRLTSTLAIVAVMDALSVICKNLSTELALATREQKSRKTTSLSTQQSVDMCHQRKVDTESCMMQLFKSVYLNRARDVDAEIRAECTAHLGTWIFNYADYFLEAAYLRYLGWYLSDKDAEVRLAAARAIARLFSQQELASGMRQFAERIRARVIEMAIREVDVNVRLEVITGTVAAFDRYGMLEDDDKIALFQLLVAGDGKSAANAARSTLVIRQAAAPILVNIFIEDQLMPELGDDVTENQLVPLMLKSLAKWIGVVVRSSRSGMETDATNGEDGETDMSALSAMTTNEFREMIQLAFDGLLPALEKLSRDHDYENANVALSLKDAILDWNVMVRLLLEERGDDDHALDDLEQVSMVTMFASAVRHRLQIHYNGDDGSERIVNFEELPLYPETSSTAASAKKASSVNAEELVRARTSFVRCMQKNLVPLLQRFAAPAALSSALPRSISICKALSVVELTLWSVVGMPATVSQPLFSAAKVWLDLRKLTEYEEVIAELVDQLYMKYTNAKVLTALGRLLFGCWRSPAGSVDSANDDESANTVLGMHQLSSTLRQLAEKTCARAEKSVVDAMSVWCERLDMCDENEMSAADLDVFRAVALRFETLVMYRCPSDDVSQMSATLLGTIKRLLEPIGMSFPECQRWAGLGTDHLDDDDEHGQDLLGDMERDDDKDARVAIAASCFRSSFSLLIWRYAALEETNNESADQQFFSDLKTFLGMASDVMRTAKRLALDIANQAFDEAKDTLQGGGDNDDGMNPDATYMSLFGDEASRGRPATSDLEIAALAEELALRYFHESRLLSDLVMGADVGTGGSGLVSMIADMLALHPVELDADGSSSGVNRAAPIASLVQHTCDFIAVMGERVLSNLLANDESGNAFGIGSSAHAKRDTELHDDDVDEDGAVEEEKLEHWRVTYLTTRSLLGSAVDNAAVVHVRRPLTVGERNHTLVAMRKCLMVYVRASWFLFSQDEWRRGSIELVARLLSWHGRWNQWVDEIVRCVVEQLRVFVTEHALNMTTVLKRSVGAVFVHALKMSTLGSRLTAHFCKRGDEASLCAQDFESGLAKLLTTVFRVKKTAGGGVDDASTATLRSIIGDVFQAASEDYLRQVLLNAAQASTRTTVAHVTTASSRAVVDELLSSGVAVLNLLTGTVGGFGTDVLLPSGAGHLYTLSRRLMEHEKKEVVCAALGRGSNEKWLAQYQRYLKTLLAIAKKGGVAVDTNPTFVTAGSSHMVGTVKGTVAKRQLRKTEIERVLDGEQDNDAQAENRRHARNERASKRHDVEQVLASDDELTVRKKKSTRTIVNHEDTTIAAGSKAEEVMTRKRLGTVGDGDDEDDDGFADSPGLKRIRRA